MQQLLECDPFAGLERRESVEQARVFRREAEARGGLLTQQLSNGDPRCLGESLHREQSGVVNWLCAATKDAREVRFRDTRRAKYRLAAVDPSERFQPRAERLQRSYSYFNVTPVCARHRRERTCKCASLKNFFLTLHEEQPIFLAHMQGQTPVGVTSGMPESFDSLRHYEFHHPREKKGAIARRLQVRASRYSYLRDPETYRPKLSDEEARAIARLLKQPVSYVRRQYGEEVA